MKNYIRIYDGRFIHFAPNCRAAVVSGPARKPWVQQCSRRAIDARLYRVEGVNGGDETYPLCKLHSSAPNVSIVRSEVA